MQPPVDGHPGKVLIVHGSAAEVGEHPRGQVGESVVQVARDQVVEDGVA